MLTAMDIMKQILSDKCVPIVAISCRIYFTMSCSVREGERWFYKISCIKNEKKKDNSASGLRKCIEFTMR
jgi:hypothetical protein